MHSLLYFYQIKPHSIYDGDTATKFTLEYGFGNSSDNRKSGTKGVRLYGINSPEMKGETLEAARVARDFLKAMVLNKLVTVESIKDGFGKYGRYLFNIYITEEQLTTGCEKFGIEVPPYEVDQSILAFSGDRLINLNQLMIQLGYGLAATY